MSAQTLSTTNGMRSVAPPVSEPATVSDTGTLYSHSRPRSTSHHSHFPSLHSRRSSVARDEQPVYVGLEGDNSQPPPISLNSGHSNLKNKHKIQTLRAELKVAEGVRVLLKETKRGGAGGVAGIVQSVEAELVEKRSLALKGDAGAGAGSGGLEALAAAALGGLEQFEGRRSRSRAASVMPSAVHAGNLSDEEHISGSSHPSILAQAEQILKKPVVAEAAVALAAAGSAAFALRRRNSSSSAPNPTRQRATSLLRSRPANREIGFAVPSPRALSLPPPPSKTYLSQLSRHEHFAIQHASAHLLLQEPAMKHVIPHFDHLIKLLQQSNERVKLAMHQRGALFGVPLKHLVKHESTQSTHGAGPGPVRIPTFIDHCITSMKQMDVTVEGILRKNGNFRQLSEIIQALDKAGDSDVVIDLAALDPITLASLFKKFLAALPDPVLTGHLFSLFVACSHIKNVWVRKRSMHLVICLMPKANRDVLEVVLLFLDWLSKHAHVSVKDGTRMDLTAIAKEMAPTLLRPHGREPKMVELPAMIAAVLNLLEDQHILHEIPYEVASVLHTRLPETKDSKTWLQHMESHFQHHRS